VFAAVCLHARAMSTRTLYIQSCTPLGCKKDAHVEGCTSLKGCLPSGLHAVQISHIHIYNARTTLREQQDPRHLPTKIG
jgi:hypothetical protein